MRLMLFSGTHPRHFHVARLIINAFEVCGIVWEEREPLVPVPPSGLLERDRRNFERHFVERKSIEWRAFGSEPPVFDGPSISVASSELNSVTVSRFVTQQRPDIVVVFGTGLIKRKLLDSLPKWSLNIHLGLSPWYRGSATLFWPFFNLEPQQAGATIHLLSDSIDGGDIIHQSVPTLEYGDGIHDVAVKTVNVAANDLVLLLRGFRATPGFESRRQRTAGRLYLSSDFHPTHLRVVYDLFDNRIVDAYLDGELGQHPPRLA